MSCTNYNLGFVAFNNPEDVESMIVSIRRWQPKGLNRCLLVDHSTDDSAKFALEAAAKSAGWTHVANENGGFGAGVNKLVLMSCDCEVLVVLNLDVHFCHHPPFLEMTKAIVQDSFSLVGTTLLNEKRLEVAGRLPPFSIEMLWYNFRSANQRRLSSGQLVAGVQAWHGAVHGACFAVQTEDFTGVGGLDEKLFLYAEEFDLHTKLTALSKRIGFVPSHSIVHHSEGKVSRENSFLNAYNLRYLAIRERRPLLFVYFTLQLVKMLFKIETNQRKLLVSLFRFDINRQSLLQKLSQPSHAEIASESMKDVEGKRWSKRVLILDHGQRLGGVEKFITKLLQGVRDYHFERVCVDANNFHLGYEFYAFIIGRRVKVRPDVVVSCHIDTARLGHRLSKKFDCPHIFREPSGLAHEFMTAENAAMLKMSTCVALTDRGLNRWRDCGFTGKGFVVPPYLPRVDHRVSVWPSGHNNLKVVMVANLYPEKRHLEVMDTLGRINASGDFAVELDIYGNSNQDVYGKSVEQAAEKLEFVTLKGGEPISPALLRTYDFAILASSHEGFGNVIIEYIQAGLPFISSNSDGVGQMITSSSILLLPEDPIAWRQAVVEFINNPSAVLTEMEYLQEFLKGQTSFIQRFKDVIDSHFSA